MMSQILEEIKSHFYTRATGLREIEDFFTYKTNEEYGVGIVNQNEVIINESFANVRIINESFFYKKEKLDLILLTSNLETHRDEFAYLCFQFVDKGLNNENRELLITNPLKWWNNWKDLIGNKMYNPETYHIIAELLTIEKLLNEGKEEVEWKGPVGSSIDVETKEEGYEVKSSLVRYENNISISSQYQIPKDDEKRYLIFYKMEKMLGGESINSVMRRLKTQHSLNFDDLEKKLERLGHVKNRESRNLTYVVHEVRKYKIDSNFPKITAESFKGNQIPHNIVKIHYVVNLDSIEYEIWQGDISD